MYTLRYTVVVNGTGPEKGRCGSNTGKWMSIFFACKSKNLSSVHNSLQGFCFLAKICYWMSHLHKEFVVKLVVWSLDDKIFCNNRIVNTCLVNSIPDMCSFGDMLYILSILFNLTA